MRFVFDCDITRLPSDWSPEVRLGQIWIFFVLLHMAITRERLEREFNLDLISTSPNVVYRVVQEDGSEIVVTASVGLAISPEDTLSPEDLSRLADARMYAEKQMA